MSRRSARPRPVVRVDCSVALPSSRHERFAQLCAAGIKPEKAYTSLGYSAKGSSQSSHKLLKREEICSRIKYLKTHAKEQCEELKGVTQGLVITKQRVIDRLDHLSRLAESEKRYGAAIQAERLLGIEVGMFIVSLDHNMKWDGDLSKLDAAQLEKVKLFMEEKIYGDDKERLERDKAAFKAEWLALHAGKGDLVQ